MCCARNFHRKSSLIAMNAAARCTYHVPVDSITLQPSALRLVVALLLHNCRKDLQQLDSSILVALFASSKYLCSETTGQCISAYICYALSVHVWHVCSMNTHHSAHNIVHNKAQLHVLHYKKDQHQTPLLELLQNPFEDCMHGTVTRPWVPAPTPPLHACPPSSLLASVL